MNHNFTEEEVFALDWWEGLPLENTEPKIQHRLKDKHYPGKDFLNIEDIVKIYNQEFNNY